MKLSTKAALVSALLFPGLGQLLVLRRAIRGCFFLVPAAIALLWLLGDVMHTANSIAEQIASGALPLDPSLISERIAASGGDGLAPQLAGGILIGAWLGSILDALLTRP